jgi:hypothetical protein
MRRRHPLIMSPLEWQMIAAPEPHPVIPVLAERGGTQIKTPRPVLLVDTREQNPFDFSRFDRAAFIHRLRLMSQYPHRLLVITSAFSQVKSPYSHSRTDPNRITQFLIAALAGLQVPFACAARRTSWEKNSWVRIFTRCICTTGWSRTQIGARQVESAAGSRAILLPLMR